MNERLNFFLLNVKEMRGGSTTPSFSSSTASNFPPITITLNSVNEDVTINKMLSPVLRYQRKVIIKNNNDGSTFYST